MEHTTRLLDTPDCEACGLPVIGAELVEGRRPTARFCSAVCSSWQSIHRGQRRPIGACRVCGVRLHPAYAIHDRYCTMRCFEQRPGRRTPGHDGRVLRPPPPPGPWALEARCLDADPDVFFPDQGAPVAEAKRICEQCPVRSECLEYALSIESARGFGVWGGLSPRERQALAGRRDADDDAPTADRGAMVRAVA